MMFSTHGHISASSAHHHSVHHQHIISASSVQHRHIISASSPYHQCIISAPSAHHQCITSASSGCHQHIIPTREHRPETVFRKFLDVATALIWQWPIIFTSLVEYNYQSVYQLLVAGSQGTVILIVSKFRSRVLHHLLCLVRDILQERDTCVPARRRGRFHFEG